MTGNTFSDATAEGFLKFAADKQHPLLGVELNHCYPLSEKMIEKISDAFQAKSDKTTGFASGKGKAKGKKK